MDISKFLICNHILQMFRLDSSLEGLHTLEMYSFLISLVTMLNQRPKVIVPAGLLPFALAFGIASGVAAQTTEVLEGFPARLAITDEEYKALIVNTTNSASVVITFEDGSTVYTDPFSETYRVTGFSETKFRTVRDHFLNVLRSRGLTQPVIESSVYIRDNPGNSVKYFEDSEGIRLETGPNYVFRAPGVLRIVARGVYPGAFQILYPNRPHSAVLVWRAVMGPENTGSSSSFTIFTSEGQSVTYGLADGLVYPSTIRIGFTSSEGNKSFASAIEVTGPPGEWFRLQKTSALGTEWTVFTDARPCEQEPLRFAIGSNPSQQFFRAIIVPAPQ